MAKRYKSSSVGAAHRTSSQRTASRRNLQRARRRRRIGRAAVLGGAVGLGVGLSRGRGARVAVRTGKVATRRYGKMLVNPSRLPRPRGYRLN